MAYDEEFKLLKGKLNQLSVSKYKYNTKTGYVTYIFKDVEVQISASDIHYTDLYNMFNLRFRNKDHAKAFLSTVNPKYNLIADMIK